MPYAREGLIDQLFDSSIKLIYVSIICLSNYKNSLDRFEGLTDRSRLPGRFSADRGVRFVQYRRGYLLLGKFKEVSHFAEQRGLRGDLQDTLQDRLEHDTEYAGEFGQAP